jgi:RHS repeat-associated protein
VTSFTYDPVSRLTGFTHDLTGTVQDLSVNGFTYNPASQITGYARSNDSYAWQGHYNIARSYGTNGLNQLTSAGATALAYDLRGNLTSSGSDVYAYTSENRMSRGKGAYLGYDNAGRLLALSNAAVTQTTYFDYDGDKLALERASGGGAILRRYVYGPGDDNPLVWYEGTGTTDRSWLHADERGSVVAVTNSTGGAFAINSYDEYGIPASNNIGRFQYTGQSWLPEVGMYYYKARIYSPTLGRFMQTDPIGYKDGINWYDYVKGDPVNRTDPTGLEGPCITLSTGCYGDRNDPATAKREQQAGYVMTGIAVVAVAAVAVETAPIIVQGVRKPGFFERAWNGLKSALGVSGSAERSSLERQIRGLEKGANTLLRRAAEHKEKIAEFIENPTIRPGMENVSKELQEAQNAARINHWQKEVAEFEKQAAAKLDEAARLRSGS